jgi:hypothetical protein
VKLERFVVCGALAICFLVWTSGCGSARAGGNGTRLVILSQGAPVASGDSLQLRTETAVAHDTLTIAVRVRNTAAREIRIELGGCAVAPELFRRVAPNADPIAGWLRSGGQVACAHHLRLQPLAAGDTITPSDLMASVPFSAIADSLPAGRYFLGAEVRLTSTLAPRFRLPAGAVRLER